MSQQRHEQLQREQQFWALVRQGIGFSAAYEAAGAHRRQGYRWRKAAGGRLPTAPRVVSKRYLCLQQRLTIADLHLNGHGIRAIAAALNRAPSTISRELSRNAPPATARAARSKLPARPRAYLPYPAHQRAAARAARPKVAKLDAPLIGPALFAYVSAKMDLRWSPQQIAHELVVDFPDRQELWVST